MSRSGPIRVATRGSALARRQAAQVERVLEERRWTVERVEVETAGDRVRDELIENLGTTGAFVRSLDERVLDGEADLAVHSLKDVPTELPDDLVIAGVPDRAPSGDVLVTPDGTDLADLPRNAVVGTSSKRRRAELLAERPDLRVEPLRGNVDTRVEKLLAPTLQAEHERRLDEDEDETGEAAEGSAADEWAAGLSTLEQDALGRAVDTEYDAIVLAEAGLRRSGLLDQLDAQRLPRQPFVPAAGQGAIAVTARDGDLAESVRALLDHPPTRIAVTAERIVLEAVGGGCIAPIGVHARLQGDQVHLDARVLGPDGEREAAVSRDLPVDRYAVAAGEAAEDLREQGATELIAAAREDGDA